MRCVIAAKSELSHSHPTISCVSCQERLASVHCLSFLALALQICTRSTVSLSHLLLKLVMCLHFAGLIIVILFWTPVSLNMVERNK